MSGLRFFQSKSFGNFKERSRQRRELGLLAVGKANPNPVVVNSCKGQSSSTTLLQPQSTPNEAEPTRAMDYDDGGIDPLNYNEEETNVSSESERERIVATCMIECNKYNGFNIVSDIQSRLSAVYAADSVINAYSQPLYAGSELSVAECAELFNNMFIRGKVSYQNRIEFMELLSFVFKNATIPTYSRSNKFSMDRIVRPVKPYLEWHVCPAGDTIYVAQHAEAVQCPNPGCGIPRTNRCSVSFCETPRELERCVHYDTRTPKKLVFYKPITDIISSLLQYKTFHDLIAYRNISKGEFGDLIDCQVPKQHLEAMREKWMNYVETHEQEFSSVKRNRTTRVVESVILKDGGEELIPINILLGVNYDGIQLYKRNTAKFTPLIVTILNLPPFLRGIVGVGMFSISVFTGGKSSPKEAETLEEFILLNCFVKELLMFENGVILENQITYGGKQYLVFVRLILHMYDTKALEGILKAQASNAYAPCPLCGLINGGLKRELDKSVYMGHRYGLTLTNILRTIGQGCDCCPENFHRDYFTESHRDVGDTLPIVKPYTVAHWDEDKTSRFLSGKQLRELIPCEGDNEHKLKVNQLAAKQKMKEFDWLHTDILDIETFIEKMMPRLFYHYSDYRPQPTTHRVTTEMYLRNAEQAFIQQYKSVNGVKGLCFYALLSYFDMETQINWDPFHVLMNIAKAIIELLKGNRNISPKVEKYCHYFFFHPDICGTCQTSEVPIEQPAKKRKASKNAKGSSSNATDQSRESTQKRKKKSKRTWQITKKMQFLFDACLQGIYVPSGNKSRFEVKQPFLHTGQQSGVAKIQIFTLLANLLCSVIDYCDTDSEHKYPVQYLYFMLMFSSDARKLMKDHFSEEDIDELHQRIIETVSTAEGVWPHSELLYPFHELTDLPQFLKFFGALKNWWTLAGERAAGRMKRNAPAQGAAKFDRVTFQKEVEDEASILNTFYSCDILSMIAGVKTFDEIKADNNIQNDVLESTLKSCHHWFDVSYEEPSRLQYDDRRIVLTDAQHFLFTEFKDYERDAFHEMMFNYIEKVVLHEMDSYNVVTSQRICDIYRNSPYLQLYFMYHKMESFMEEPSFTGWLSNIMNDEQYGSASYPNTNLETISNFDLLRKIKQHWSHKAVSLAPDYFQINAVFAKRGHVGGVQFIGRGHNYREDARPRRAHAPGYGNQKSGYIPNKDCNSLRHWRDEEQKDSWCKYDNHLNGKSYFAQLNGFFKLHYPGDMLLDGLCFASVTQRKTCKFGFENRLDAVSLMSLDNYYHNVEPFVLLDTITLHTVMHFPIQGLQHPTTGNVKPILKPCRDTAGEYKDKDKLGESAFCDISDVKFLCLLPIDA